MLIQMQRIITLHYNFHTLLILHGHQCRRLLQSTNNNRKLIEQNSAPMKKPTAVARTITLHVVLSE